MSRHDPIPDTVSAHLDARPAPSGRTGRDGPAAPVQQAPAGVPVAEKTLRLSIGNDLKLLFAALGAGGSVVPLGDNGRTTRLLSQYAASLRDH